MDFRKGWLPSVFCLAALMTGGCGKTEDSAPQAPQPQAPFANPKPSSPKPPPAPAVLKPPAPTSAPSTQSSNLPPEFEKVRSGDIPPPQMLGTWRTVDTNNDGTQLSIFKEGKVWEIQSGAEVKTKAAPFSLSHLDVSYFDNGRLVLRDEATMIQFLVHLPSGEPSLHSRVWQKVSNEPAFDWIAKEKLQPPSIPLNAPYKILPPDLVGTWRISLAIPDIKPELSITKEGKVLLFEKPDGPPSRESTFANGVLVPWSQGEDGEHSELHVIYNNKKVFVGMLCDQATKAPLKDKPNAFPLDKISDTPRS